MQDNVEDAIQEVQDNVDNLDTNKLDKTSVKTTYTASGTDTYSCNYVNGLETYSTTETRVGTWIDGKPIYRKVYLLSAIAGSNSYTLNPAPSNVDLMWFDLSATFLIQSSGMVRQGTNPASDSNYDFSARVISDTRTTVNFYVGPLIADNSTIYVSLLYTKTTD